MKRYEAGIMRCIYSLTTLIAVAAFAPLDSVKAEEITLAAGAGFRRPIAEVASAFEKAQGHKVAQIYGHMGQVIAQARDSGKVSVVCGDRSVLDSAKGVSFASFARLGQGKLVVAYRKGLAFTKPEDITQAAVKRVGIPDQTNAIYGKAGRQFLDRTKLAAQIDPKLLAVATVPQVTSYIGSGEVDAGFINATDAIGAGANIGGFVEVDQKLYDPVEVSCAAVSSAVGSAAVAGFLKFSETSEARAILTRYGL